MAEHKLAPGRALIDGLKDLGQGLGYYAEGVHPVKEGSVNSPAVDVAWKADKEQPFPLMIFEVVKFPRQGGQGAENLRKKSRHVHENRTEPQDLRS